MEVEVCHFSVANPLHVQAQADGVVVVVMVAAAGVVVVVVMGDRVCGLPCISSLPRIPITGRWGSGEVVYVEPIRRLSFIPLKPTKGK